MVNTKLNNVFFWVGKMGVIGIPVLGWWKKRLPT
jgi:hypothetical protein